jgi:hypothetical protein
MLTKRAEWLIAIQLGGEHESGQKTSLLGPNYTEQLSSFCHPAVAK